MDPLEECQKEPISNQELSPESFPEPERCVAGPAWRGRCAERIARTGREKSGPPSSEHSGTNMVMPSPVPIPPAASRKPSTRCLLVARRFVIRNRPEETTRTVCVLRPAEHQPPKPDCNYHVQPQREALT